MDSLAILERGHFFPTASAGLGVEADCPFCVARYRPEVSVGERGIVLAGHDAGVWVEFRSTKNDGVVDAYAEDGRRGLSIYNRDHSLVLPHRLMTVASYLPPFSLKLSFIIDELAVWFCNEAICGKGFHWSDELIIEVARTCWERRLPISPSELSRVLLAHGLPSEFHQRAEGRFKFAIDAFIAARGRPAIKKLRNGRTAMDELLEFYREGLRTPE